MKINQFIILTISLVVLFACSGQKTNQETDDNSNSYYDKKDVNSTHTLIAVTNEQDLEYGAQVAYINLQGDTIIPFGKYAYLGTDTLKHFANVMTVSKNSTSDKWVAIDGQGNTLYDIVTFDNGPDYFKEGLVRAERNGKMGFANEYGQIVIPCKYDFAWPFEGGKAKVSFKVEEIADGEHTQVDSEMWFFIDRQGQETK